MSTCVQCGQELDVPARGRRPKYCSRSCQARAYRARVVDRTERTRPAEENRAPAPPPPQNAEVPPAADGARAETARGGNLSRDRIVRTAIRVADADGLETMSMRRVAEILGVKVMSLYYYIDGKDRLIELMVEEAYRGHSEPERAPQGWRGELESSARWEWTLYSTHAWVLEVLATVQPPFIPSVVADVERCLRALESLGLDPVTAQRVYLSVNGLVQGLALLRVSEHSAERRGDLPLSQWRAVTASDMLEKLRADHNHQEQASSRDDAEFRDLDALFEFSLQRHLDGLALFLEPGRAVGGGR